MSEKSSFFNAELVGETWDRTYTAEDYANYFGSFIGNGVFPNPSTNLQIAANGDMTITVKDGKAWINGYMYHNDSDLIIQLDPADGALKRIDRIVVKLDFTNRVISCKVKKGAFASSPIAPTLQRDMDIYELGIADILIDNGVISIIQSKITDTRLNTDLCGIVTQTVNEIDTNELYNKLQAYIDERGQDVALWVDTATTQWGIEFNTWFDTIKGILSGDIAGNLANRIIILENTVNNLELTATNVTIADTGNKFTATNVEGALLEAINKADSAFQSANSGKTTLATAIGSPVINTDTFSAMGTKIDTLTQIFKDNLISKGISILGTDKISSLIDKITTIKPLPNRVYEGSNYYVLKDATTKTMSEQYYVLVSTTSNFKIAGDYIASIETSTSWGSGRPVSILFSHTRGANIVNEKVVINYSTPFVKSSNTFVDVLPGDTISFYIKNYANPGATMIGKNCEVCCELTF